LSPGQAPAPPPTMTTRISYKAPKLLASMARRFLFPGLQLQASRSNACIHGILATSNTTSSVPNRLVLPLTPLPTLPLTPLPTLPPLTPLPTLPLTPPQSPLTPPLTPPLPPPLPTPLPTLPRSPLSTPPPALPPRHPRPLLQTLRLPLLRMLRLLCPPPNPPLLPQARPRLLIAMTASSAALRPTSTAAVAYALRALGD
jgi:hypothetical protein